MEYKIHQSYLIEAATVEERMDPSLLNEFR
jgi:hypothetical protein